MKGRLQARSFWLCARRNALSVISSNAPAEAANVWLHASQTLPLRPLCPSLFIAARASAVVAAGHGLIDWLIDLEEGRVDQAEQLINLEADAVCYIASAGSAGAPIFVGDGLSVAHQADRT